MTPTTTELYRWVKASERMPTDENEIYVLRRKNNDGGYNMDIVGLLKGFFILVDQERPFIAANHLHLYEWLEKSSLPAANEWVAEKPDKECVFISATKYIRNEEDLLWDYAIWQIKKLDGEDEHGNTAWYFGLLNGDGEEWGPLEDLEAALYHIITPPTTLYLDTNI